MGERKDVLFAIGGMEHISDVHLALVLRASVHDEESDL